MVVFRTLYVTCSRGGRVALDLLVNLWSDVSKKKIKYTLTKCIPTHTHRVQRSYDSTDTFKVMLPILLAECRFVCLSSLKLAQVLTEVVL